MIVRRAIAGALQFLLVALLAGGSSCHRGVKRLTVAAAVSLKEPMQAAAARWEKSHPGWKVDLDLAGSGGLLEQIEAGAPVDAFVSASTDEMTRLEHDGLVRASTVVVIAHNRVVLVTPAGAGAGTVTGWSDLAAPRVAHVAIGNPQTVPAGRYARAALQVRGLWDAVRPKLVYGEHVRQVLAYVEQGSVDAGLVYATDAKTSHAVVVRAMADGPGDPQVTYPAAPLLRSAHPAEAAAFCASLDAPAMQADLRAAGFLP